MDIHGHVCVCVCVSVCICVHVTCKSCAFRDYYLTGSLTSWQVTCRTTVGGGLTLANLLTGLKGFAVLVAQTGHKYSQGGKVLHGVCNKSGGGSWQGTHHFEPVYHKSKSSFTGPLFRCDVLYVCAGYCK